MKKYLLLVAVSLLSGCTLLPQKNNVSATLDAPKNLKHNGKNYYLSYNKDLGSVARYMYLEKKENTKNWKSAVELLLDRNEEDLSLGERIELREKVYKNTGIEHFNLYEKDDMLYGFVIYAPSAQHNDWQVNVSKGMNIEDCGFVQYQY
ncbi:MAG TPA: 6-phosphofructokinase, partial [Pasteurellaceae bacterium]|nr:6-phosphofructokinase [Pasteurellaceae bacterium]